MRPSVNRARGSHRASRCGAGAVPALESLESRVFLAASPVSLSKAAEVAARVDSKLLALHDKVARGADAKAAGKAERLSVDGQGLVSVTVRADDVRAVSAALAAKVGFQLTASRPDLHRFEGRLPIDALKNVSKLVKNVGRYGVRAGYEPITLTGSVNSQADFVMEADRVRGTLPASINGAGQRVGVISDSYNRLSGAAAGIASGDLPAGGVTVLQDSFTTRDTDEGRAMLELVHDVAPGASLAFATANGGELNFAANIRALADPTRGDADVIVDDIVYPTEPMFQDGVVAQAINEVVTTRGVNYFSAAGNQSSQAYESTVIQTATDTVTFPGGGTVSGAFFDFNPATTGTSAVDTRQRITLPGGGQVYLTFQWDDPFYKSGGVGTDLDIFLVNPATGQVVASSTYDNRFFDEPVEIVAFTNPNALSMALDVAILRYDGEGGTDPSANPGRIKYVNYGSGITFNDAYAGINAPTLVPHAGAANGQGVAAARYAQQDRPEPFTSKGKQTVLFSPTGTRIAAETRNAPQVTGVDGTNTTFFGGGDYEADGRPNFFGTSAAAPHVAAVAALVRQANPAFTPAAVYERLQSTADDIVAPGVAAAGFDDLTGFGLVNAFDAVYPSVTPARLNFSDDLEGGALSTAYETRSTGAGRIVVTPADLPFAGVRHLTLDASTTEPSLNEVTLHVDASAPGTKTLSFRHREFADDDDAMPATFTGSVNKDGVALSVDGVNWHRVVSLTGTDSSQSYALRTFNLSAVAAAANLTLSADTRIRFQQYGLQPIAADGFAFDDITVTNTPVPSAAPGVPDLLPISDKGASDSDDITFRNNGAARSTLEFTVPGTIPGAVVSLYADGDLIGTKVAAAGTTSTLVRTNGSVVLADGVRSITARQTEPGNTESPGSAALAVTIDTAAPTVSHVFVAGSSWGNAFLGFLGISGRGDAAAGFRLDAARHADELPWTNLNKVSVRFSENVSVSADDLVVRGVNTAVYAPGPANAFSYNSATFTATWTLATAGILQDKLLLDLDGDISGAGTTDIAGTPLDGEWTNATSTPQSPGSPAPLNSGDGAPGGDFRFRINVLAGDVNRNGSVSATDLNLVKLAQGAARTSNLYSVFKDVNGTGTIMANDVNLVRGRQGAKLPLGEPAAPAALASSSPTSSSSAPLTFSNGTVTPRPAKTDLASLDSLTQKRLANDLLA